MQTSSPKERVIRRKNIMSYFDDLMEKHFSKKGFADIVEIIIDLENGVCGVETSYSTYPGLLLALGITPQRNYQEENGFPPSNGRSAASPRQRKIIITALKKAGYDFILPPWLKNDFTPKKVPVWYNRK